MYKKIIKALYETKVNRSINESYATVKERFIRDGADKAEVKSVLDLHKKLKDMKRLNAEEINIDVLAKGKSFDEFTTLMSRYTEKDTATKKDKFNELKNKIVSENDEWTVYKIDTAEEAYLFHGLTKWCIVSGSEADAERHFNYYVFRKDSNFYFIVRKNPTGDKWDYIALQLQKGKLFSTYWDKNDKSYKLLPKELNLPELDVKYEPMVRPIQKSWKLNNDGTYDVNGDVDLNECKQFINDDGKLTIKFNKVSRSFYCDHLNLTSLEGCPKEVGKDFYCTNNKLTSLEGAPEKVGGDFYCSFNKLNSLKGAPKDVEGSFICNDNNLTSLKEAPEKVGGNFKCFNNNLTSLEGAPEKVGGDFYCPNNNLTSLEGSPEKVGGDFDCSENKLTSLEGAPKEVDGNFYILENTKKFISSDVKKVCKVGDEIHV